MKIRSLAYHIKDGFKNIHRNKMFSLASIATITACIFLFGVFYLIVKQNGKKKKGKCKFIAFPLHN